MKRLSTILIGLVAALAVQAQSDFPLQFAHANGNIIADGTVLTLNDFEDDGFGSIMVPANLYVKNVSGTDVLGGGVYTVVNISTGVFQTCFPMNCVMQTEPGQYQTEAGSIAAGQLKSMMTEWLTEEGVEGTAVVTYQLYTFKQNPLTKETTKDQAGPTVTLNFSYGTAAVSTSLADKPVSSISYYNLQGRPVSQPRHGLYIVRTCFADGTQTLQKCLLH